MATSSESANTKFWTVEKEQILIDMWSQSACLFMISSPDYSGIGTRKYDAMQEIAQAMETTVDDIKKKMTSIRAAFNRARRSPPSGSASKKDEWLIKNLDFLNSSSGISRC
ncbi:hypothetical protein LOTGIDRAFT_154979 [Lottia gigantea]|uniref:MADF domain-containing protein n=1 Tax=Lottia gigantea TaxID=225164 RepID=V4B9D7_LOTGI|nr:hypothetical protein LOTGIDRAFT_154979 [Lottia gigantea]ESO85489.1 hypothetical protein LOTGIDRAFT_154979 [Lottia gigantea]